MIKKLAKKCLDKGTLENNTIFLHSFALNHSFLSVPETVSEGFVLKKKRNDKSRMCVLSTRNWDMLLSIYLTSLHSFTACFLHSFLNSNSLLFVEKVWWKGSRNQIGSLPTNSSMLQIWWVYYHWNTSFMFWKQIFEWCLISINSISFLFC